MGSVAFVLRATTATPSLGVEAGDFVIIRPGDARPVEVLRRLQDVPRSAWAAAVLAGTLAADPGAGLSSTLQQLQAFADEPLPGFAAEGSR